MATTPTNVNMSDKQQDLPEKASVQTVLDENSVQAIDVDDQKSKKDGNTSKKGDKDVSNKIQTLRNSKKSAKTRLTKAKKQLNDLLEKPLPDVPLASKNAIRRGINKVNSEVGIIEKIIGNLKEIYAVNVDHEETEAAIEIVDKELEEQHVQERLANGEAESVLTSRNSQKK